MQNVKCSILPVLLMVLLFLQGCVSKSQRGDEPGERRYLTIPQSWQSASVVLAEWNTDLEFIVDAKKNLVKETDTKWYKVNNLNEVDTQYINILEHRHIEYPVKIAATAYYPDGTHWTLPEGKIMETEIDFSDSMVHTFYVPKYQPDILLKVEVQRVYDRPEFTGYYPLQHEHPLLKRTITLSSPQDSKLRNGIENRSDFSIDESFTIENGKRIKQITATEMIDFREPERTQYPEEYYAGFYVSYPPAGKESYSWQELGDHYLELLTQAFKRTSTIDQLAGSIPDNSPIQEQIGAGFLTIVEKIRYHLDSSGGYGFYPREASVVLTNGYGDCKELSTIMKSVLSAKNIESYPVLLATWGAYQPMEEYPSLAGFNHMVLAAKTDTGNLRYLDGTHSWATAKNSFYDSVGRKGFILEHGNSRVERIEVDESFDNRVITNSIIEHDQHRHWIIKGDIKLLGYPALRFYEKYQESGRKDKSRLAGTYLQEGFDIYAEDVEVTELSGDTVSIKYIASFEENYLSLGEGGLKLSTPGLFKIDVNHQLTDKLGPVYLHQFTQEDHWSIPFPADNSELPTFLNSIAKSSWEVNGRHVKRQYVQNEVSMGAVESSIRKWTKHLGGLKNSVVWR